MFPPSFQDGFHFTTLPATSWLANFQLSLSGQKQCGYGLNCFTASTQRPHSVGCSAFWPMSVSQCQQRSHFSSRRDNWKLASYEVAGLVAEKNIIVPQGTMENFTTNIFLRIQPGAFGEMPHIPLETILFDDARPDSRCIP